MDSATQKYYSTNAHIYVKNREKRNIAPLREHFSLLLPPPATILDLGCGTCQDTIAFQARGYTVIGFDAVGEFLHLAKGNLDLTLLQGDIEWLPFLKNSFAGIWACASLLHIEKSNIASVFSSLRDILVPGGMLFVSMKAGNGEKRDETGRLFSYYSQNQLAELALDANFSSVETSTAPDFTGRDIDWITLVAVK